MSWWHVAGLIRGNAPVGKFLMAPLSAPAGIDSPGIRRPNVPALIESVGIETTVSWRSDGVVLVTAAAMPLAAWRRVQSPGVVHLRGAIVLRAKLCLVVAGTSRLIK